MGEREGADFGEPQTASEGTAIIAGIATREMIDFLVSEKGMSRDEAYLLCSLDVDLHVTQLVDYTKGIHPMLRKSVIH